MDAANSNRAIAQFNLDFMEATNDIFFWMHTESSLLSKVAKGYFIANIFLPYHVGSLVGLAYHEFGHGGRSDALGYDHYYQLAFFHLIMISIVLLFIPIMICFLQL